MPCWQIYAVDAVRSSAKIILDTGSGAGVVSGNRTAFTSWHSHTIRIEGTGLAQLWDQRIGKFLAGKIAATWIRPNHVTAVDLVIGLASGIAIGTGYPNLGAFLFLAARLIDCVDGELARIQGSSSKFGAYFDLVTGTLTYLSLFAGLGAWSYLNADPGYVTILLAVVLAAVVVNALLLLVRQWLLHDDSEEFPTIGAINLEDGAYLIPVAIWFGFPYETFAAVTIGAAIFVCWHVMWTGYRVITLLRSSK
jgi:phosphatidylglycerophosphate synthase